MALEMLIRQHRLFMTKLDLSFLKEICREQKLEYGVPNQAYVLDSYAGGEQIAEVLFVLYNAEAIGRGFSFVVMKNRHDCELRLNVPCAPQDVENFYAFAEAICRKLGVTRVEQDNVTVAADKLKEQRILMSQWNKTVLKDFARRAEHDRTCLQLFGAVYPISMESEITRQLLDMEDTEAAEFFAKHLHDKQNADYYYAKPLFFDIDGARVGIYALTQDACTVFPIEPEVPILSGVKLQEIDRWEVRFGAVTNSKEGYSVLGSMPFKQAARAMQLEDRPRFDGRHVIVELNREDMDKMF